MKTEPEHIPDAIFDWLGTRDFSSLSASEQAEVLRHFSMEEYEELHESVKEIKAIVPPVSTRNKTKYQLLYEFDKQHGPAVATVKKLWEPRMFLRIAAAIMLFMSGWLGYSLFHTDVRLPAELLAATDTVYVTKEVPATAETIHDTVYILKVKQAKSQENEQIAAADPIIDEAGPYAPDDLNVASIKDIDGALNAFKRNSLKYDSLIRMFSFIGL
jgi:hypothetical protein